MSTPQEITQAELMAELDRIRVDPYANRRKQFTPEMDDLIIAARTPDAQGRIVTIEALARFFRDKYHINSPYTIKAHLRELEREGRL